MQLKNYLMSVEKWTAIKEEFDKPGRVDWEEICSLICKPCGHCIEHRGRDYIFIEFTGCGNCSLIPLCGGDTESDYDEFENMADNDIPRSKRKARSIVNRIYNQILKDDPREGEDV